MGQILYNNIGILFLASSVWQVLMGIDYNKFLNVFKISLNAFCIDSLHSLVLIVHMGSCYVSKYVGRDLSPNPIPWYLSYSYRFDRNPLIPAKPILYNTKVHHCQKTCSVLDFVLYKADQGFYILVPAVDG